MIKVKEKQNKIILFQIFKVPLCGVTHAGEMECSVARQR